MKYSAALALASAATASAFAPSPSVQVARKSSALNIAVGDSIPSVNLHSGFPPDMVDLAEYAKGKSLVMVGLPGAFTPTWSNQQVPGYLEKQDALKEAGVDEVLVWCVNDAAVMGAWAEDQGVADDDDNFIRMMGDPAGELTDALDMKMTHPGPPSVGIIGRCKRHALHIVDGTVKVVSVSEGPDDPAGDDDPSATLAPAMLDNIKGE